VTRTFSALAMSFVACLSVHTFAQQPANQEITRQVRLGRAPVSNSVLAVHLPEPPVHTLPNGLRYVILQDHSTPLVSVSLSIQGAGPLLEPSSQRGVAVLTASILRQGTTTKTAAQLAEAIDRLGANIGANAPFGAEAVTVYGGGLSKNLQSWFPLFADVVLHPVIDSEELKLALRRQLANIEQRRADPGTIATDRMYRDLYDDFPAGYYLPSPAQVSSLTQDEIRAFHTERYAPQNAVLAIQGDIEPAIAKAMIEKLFAGWKTTSYKPQIPSLPMADLSPSPRTIAFVERANSVQTELAVGKIGIRRTDPDFFPLAVTNYLLGGSSTARLFTNLREEKGYTYGAYSSLTPLQYPGPFIAATEVRSAVTTEALQEIQKEITRLSQEDVQVEALQRAHRGIIAAFALSIEQPSTMLSQQITRIQYSLPTDYWNTYPVHISSVTAKDIRRVSASHLDPTQMHVVVVGNREILPRLATFGKVSEFDKQGQPVVGKP
jgi:zinc protease